MSIDPCSSKVSANLHRWGRMKLLSNYCSSSDRIVTKSQPSHLHQNPNTAMSIRPHLSKTTNLHCWVEWSRTPEVRCCPKRRTSPRTAATTPSERLEVMTSTSNNLPALGHAMTEYTANNPYPTHSGSTPNFSGVDSGKENDGC